MTRYMCVQTAVSRIKIFQYVKTTSGDAAKVLERNIQGLHILALNTLRLFSAFIPNSFLKGLSSAVF